MTVASLTLSNHEFIVGEGCNLGHYILRHARAAVSRRTLVTLKGGGGTALLFPHWFVCFEKACCTLCYDPKGQA